jgi:hypothetical protein
MHPFAAFTDSLVWQANDAERGKPRRDLALYLDGARF